MSERVVADSAKPFDHQRLRVRGRLPRGTATGTNVTERGAEGGWHVVIGLHIRRERRGRGNHEAARDDESSVDHSMYRNKQRSREGENRKAERLPLLSDGGQAEPNRGAFLRRHKLRDSGGN